LRKWVNSGKGLTMLEHLVALRTHYDTLCGYIYNMAIMAATDKSSHDQSLYAMNTNRLFIFALELHE